MTMRIRTLEGRCVGAGQCVLAAPDLFDQSDEDGTVVVLRDVVDAEHEAGAQAALGRCPSGTIRLEP